MLFAYIPALKCSWCCCLRSRVASADKDTVLWEHRWKWGFTRASDRRHGVGSEAASHRWSDRVWTGPGLRCQSVGHRSGARCRGLQHEVPYEPSRLIFSVCKVYKMFTKLYRLLNRKRHLVLLISFHCCVSVFSYFNNNWVFVYIYFLRYFVHLQKKKKNNSSSFCLSK